MSSTSEELASQAEHLQSSISYFRISDRPSQARPAAASRAKPETDLRSAVMAAAPHMPRSRASGKAPSGGGFDLDLADDGDDLDADFRRGAA